MSMNRRDIMAGAAALAVAGGVAAPALAGGSDRYLLELERRLRDAIEADKALERSLDMYSPEGEAAFDAAIARTGEIVLEIERTPATTFRGLQVKAFAVAWCMGIFSIADLGEVEFGDTQEVRIASNIVRTLLNGVLH